MRSLYSEEVKAMYTNINGEMKIKFFKLIILYYFFFLTNYYNILSVLIHNDHAGISYVVAFNIANI